MRALISCEIESVDGTAEAIPCGDGTADAVTCGQSFHWFRPEAALDEIHRVLRPEGGLAILANVRDEAHPLQRAFLGVLARCRAHPSLEAVSHPLDLLAGDSRFAPPELHRFPHVQRLDAEAFVAQAASETSIALLGDTARADALRDFRALAADAGEIELHYSTEVYSTRTQL
jgi:SAM-dependent methyltransferase